MRHIHCSENIFGVPKPTEHDGEEKQHEVNPLKRTKLSQGFEGFVYVHMGGLHGLTTVIER